MSRYLNERLQKLEAYVPGEQPRDLRYIKLNTNESPYPPAPEVLEALGKPQIADLRLYSDPTCRELKGKLAALYDVSPENILLTNGSDDVLNFAFMAYAGDKGAVFPDITYGFYPVFAQLHGVQYEQVPLEEDFTLNYRGFCGVNKMVVIANPNAPTGLSIPVWQIEQILQSNPDTVVVIDEAYVDFGGTSAYPLIRRYDNLLVVRTFSKSRCLAGGRLGFALGNAALIDDLEKLRCSTNPYNINRLTMLLGEATVDADAYYRDKCREIMATRDWTKSELRKLGFTVLDSDANFLFAASDRIDGQKLYSELKNNGILVRHFTGPRIRNYNRITIGTQAQMEIFIDTVRRIIHENCCDQ